MLSEYKIIIPSMLICLILIAISCVEPVIPEIDENDSAGMLVVDGKITDEEGPFTVILSTSIPVNTMYYNNPVQDADVRIFDDAGNSYILNGNQNGRYETEDKTLKGVPGRSYTLSITTAEGIQYESSAVLMQEVPEIDSLYFEEVMHPRFVDNEVIDETWLNIHLDSHDPLGKTRYWHFEFVETWEVLMLTDNLPVEHSPPDGISNITMENISTDPDRLVCWVTKPSTSIMIASTVNSPDDRIKKYMLNSLGPGADKLHIRYSLLARQSAISRELYEFWKQLEDANENTGGMYDQMPGQIFGNISCCGTGSRALGYFSAMSVREKRIFIEKTNHHVETVSAYKGCLYYSFQHPWVPNYYFGNIMGGGEAYSLSPYCADCNDYGTNVKPDFWK